MGTSVEAFHSSLYNTFRYSEKEMSVLAEVVKNREEASTLFYKAYFELEEKKDKALQTADLGKLLVDFGDLELPKEEMMRNKLIAKHVMLPDVLAT